MYWPNNTIHSDEKKKFLRLSHVKALKRIEEHKNRFDVDVANANHVYSHWNLAKSNHQSFHISLYDIYYSKHPMNGFHINQSGCNHPHPTNYSINHHRIIYFRLLNDEHICYDVFKKISKTKIPLTICNAYVSLCAAPLRDSLVTSIANTFDVRQLHYKQRRTN